MTIHLAPMPNDRAASVDWREGKPGIGVHIFVAIAIGLVGLAIALFWSVTLAFQPVAGLIWGVLFCVSAMFWHLKISNSANSPPLRLTTFSRRATANKIDNSTRKPSVEQTTEIDHTAAAVEPSDLALALLASLKTSAEELPQAQLAEDNSWTWALAAQLPPESSDHLDEQSHQPQMTSPVGAHAFDAAGPESEFERVDRLVKRLADNVNQAQAMREAQLPNEPQESNLASHQLTNSINALKRANAAAPPLVPAETSLAWPKPEPLAFPGPHGENQRSSILSALNAQRMDVFLEPILDLSVQRPQHYEVSISLRTVSGHAINLAEAASDLSGTGLLPLIDQARIARAGQIARRLAERGKAGAVFTDLNGESLEDGGFKDTFANTTFAAGAFPGQLVLTLPQSHVMTFTTADWHTLARLRNAGFGFALSDVTTLDMDFSRLAEAGFTFARLDAETFLIGLPTADAVVPPQDICRHLAESGLVLIVGGILEDHQLARVFGFGVVFGQGALFGGPRPMKEQATNASRPAGQTATSFQ